MSALDNLSQETRSKVDALIAKFCNEVSRRQDSVYFKSLFDPVQTHAVYGLTQDNYDEVKSSLTKLGAKKFRKVKVRSSDFLILCFNAAKMESKS